MARQSLTEGVRGSGVTLIGSLVGMVLQVASVVILSRLLTPEDFGIFAMVAVFITLGNLIRDFGMPMAALQARLLSHQQASNLFWVNAGLAAAASIILALASPLLVVLYGEPRLLAIVPAMAAVIFITGVGAQIQIDLARRMRFGSLVVSDLIGQVSGLMAAIAVAWLGHRYWALVAQGLVASALTLAWRWVVARWRPARFRRGHDSTPLIRAGTQYGLAYLLTFAQNNADTLIVGTTLGATQLGFYNRGYQLLTAPGTKLLDPLTQVVVPMLHRARDEGRSVEELLLQIQFAAGLGMVWIFSMAAGLATRLVPLMLGPGWEPTVPVFQILAIGGAIWVFSHVSYWVFIVNEKSRELLHYNLVSKPIAVACLAFGSLFGIQGVAWGYVVAMAVSWPLNLVWLARCVGLRSTAFARNGAMILLAGGLSGVIVSATTVASGGMAPVVAVAAGLVVGTAVMLATLGMLPAARSQLRALTRLPGLLLGARN